MTSDPARAVLAGEMPYRMPVAPAVGADHAARRAGVDLRTAMTDPEILAGVLLSAHAAYDPDLVVVFSDVTVEAEALGATVEWTDGLPPRIRDTIDLGAAAVLDPDRAGRMPVVLSAARNVVRELGDRMPVLVSLKGPFSLAALAFGLPELLLAPRSQARNILALLAEGQAAYVRAIVRTGGIPLIGDPFASGSVLGPCHFRELALPGLARLTAEAHALGSLAAVHVCGDAETILDDLLAAGADLLHVEGADLLKIAAAGTVAMGGVPTEALLESDEAVERAVRSALEHRPDPRRFLFSTACDVPTNAPEERVRLLVDSARKAG